MGASGPGRVQELLEAARRLPPAQWQEQLEGLPPDLRSEVEKALAQMIRSADVRVPVPPAPPDLPAAASPLTLDTPLPQEGPGARIGRYKLLQRIGEGGMGAVFLAEQEHPIRRRVALKIIKLGMDTKQVIARFEAERQALAMMDHPNIAKVLDAGTTDTGRPYFAMELVKGVPVTEYCDANKLSTRERLELFVPVCRAVQHAHQKGIIHRDLKPTNVLVTLHDGIPIPKVIDFGIAKATNSRLTEMTLFTEFRQLIGTPEYMSPEQAEMSAIDIDTRSDIYSLGVLLYELLTGTTPFDPKQLREQTYEALLRIIREVEPPKPSTRLSTSGPTLSQVANRRRADPRKLSQQIRGELDWIVMKCLEKDRTRRYETANGLAMDVQRHLNNEAVLASPPSAGYRFRKFALRHRHALGITLVVVVMALVAGAATVRYALQQRRLAQDRNAFEHERDAAISSLQKLSAITASGFGPTAAQAVAPQTRIENAVAQIEELQSRTSSDLYRALMHNAAAVRLARLPGYRATVWANLHQANRLNTRARNPEDIKKEVLACLGDPIGLPGVEGATGSTPGPRNFLKRAKSQRATHGDLRVVLEPVGENLHLVLYGKESTALGSVRTPLGNKVYDLEFSPNGRLLAVACDQGVAVLEVPALTQHTFYRGQWASSVAFDPSGNILASTGDYITLWSMRSNRPLAILPRPGKDQSSVRVEFTSDGQTLAALVNDTVVSAWRVGSTPEMVQLAGHFGGVPTVVYSPDGQFIASVGKDLLVKIWDGRSGALRHDLEGHRVPIQTAAFHPDSTLLATGDDSGEILVWDPRDNQQLGRIDATALSKPWRMHFDDSGRYLIVAGVRGIGAWAIHRLSQNSVSAEQFFKLETSQRVADIAVHPSGMQFAFTSGEQVFAYDLTNAQLRALAGAAPWAYFNSLHFAPNGQVLRYTSNEERLGIVHWPGDTPAGITDTVVKSIAQTSDGRWLATYAPSEGIIIVDAETRRRWGTLPSGDVEVWTMAWSPDGRRLAAAHADGAVELWDLEQVRARLAEFDISLPSTIVRQGASPVPQRLSEAAFQQIINFHKDRPHRWTPPIAMINQYTGPDRFPPPVEEWPRWRGPRGDQISRETALASVWPPAGPPMLWRAFVGLGYASPVASRGRVYLFSLHQNLETLTAFNALTGEILWTESEGNGFTGRFVGTRATPTIDGDAIYTYGGDGTLIRRDLATGRRTWRLDVLRQIRAENLAWGTASSPLVLGSRVYIQGGKGGPVAVAVDKETGHVEWISEARGEAGYAAPLVVDVMGTPQLIVVGATAVYGMDPSNGKAIWTQPWKTESRFHVGIPTYADGVLLVSDDRGAIMLKLSPAGAQRLSVGTDITSSFYGPILDGRLLFTTDEDTLICASWPDLTRRFSTKLSPGTFGVTGSFVRFRDRLVAIGRGGILSLVRTDTTGAAVMSHLRLVPPRDPQFVWPAPLIYGGRLYLKSEEELRCFDLCGSTPPDPAAAGVAQPSRNESTVGM